MRKEETVFRKVQELDLELLKRLELLNKNNLFKNRVYSGAIGIERVCLNGLYITIERGDFLLK